MSVDIRLPDINAGTPAEQFLQMKSYLYQLAQQLNWALNTMSTGGDSNGGGVVVNSSTGSKPISNKNAEETFEALKSLIIDSADIVNAYYEDISKRLESVYVAQSDFGTYTQELNAYLEANPEAVTQYYSFFADLKLSQEALDAAFRDYKIETGGYIRTGIVYYEDNIPVYGVAVGQNLTTTTIDGEEVVDQNNFRAIFTAQKLSFWQDSTEVAYLSNNKLYITNSTVLENLQVGQWAVRSGNGLAFKWIGG